MRHLVAVFIVFTMFLSKAKTCQIHLGQANRQIFSLNSRKKSAGFALAVAIVAICEDFYFLAPKI